MFNNKGGMAQLAKQAQAMQEKMMKMQEELALMEIEGQSGGGLVKVVISGKHHAKRVSIDPTLVGDDKDMLEDLIVAAFNDAVRKLQVLSDTRTASATAGFKMPF